jgi:hypothetical protein
VGIHTKIVSPKFSDRPGLLDEESVSLVLDKPHPHRLVHAKFVVGRKDAERGTTVYII